MKKIHIEEFEIIFLKRVNQKSIRLRINKQHQVILSAPFFCTQSKALSFAQENIDWLRKNYQKQKELQTFQANQKITLMGKEYIIIHTEKQKRGVYTEENYLYVSGELPFLHRRVRDYAKRQLLQYITKRATEMAAQINQKPAKITLRDTTSRWGSCSSNKNLSFCWKIVLAPTFVIDYLIAHEVSHLKEMNHGPEFWKTVALFNTKQADAQIWLRRHGQELQSWQ